MRLATCFGDHPSTSLRTYLGNSSVVGNIVDRAQHLPFGGFRGGTPSYLDDVTSKGFTGHQENADIGLTYMNARYYVGGIGRFASADTIVPDPTNPQSYNRFSYTRNNPLNLVDPTGHKEICDSSTSSSRDCELPPPLVDFTVTKGKKVKWTEAEKKIIWKAAWDIAKALFLASDGLFSSYQKAFLAVYGGTVTFNKTGESASNLGFTQSRNLIDVNEHKQVSVVSLGKRWAAHELGHAFSKALYPNTTDDLEYGQGIIDLATSDIGYTDEFGSYRQIAGGCETTNYLTSCYTSESDGFVRRDNNNGTPSEDFADMFSGYVNGFSDNDAGRVRYNWMDKHMQGWINLAVTNNSSR